MKRELLNMLPSLTSNDVMNARSINAVFFRQPGHQSVASIRSSVKPSPYISYVVFVELGFCVASSASGSPLTNTVCNVVCRGSQEKMIGIYARRVIAFMTNHFALGYRAVGNLITDSMRYVVDLFTVFRGAEKSIALLLSDASPQPACICFFHVAPESLVHLLPSVFQEARTATKPSRNLPEIARRPLEYYAAVFAGAWYFVGSWHANLHRQVSCWLGPLENANSFVGRLHCSTGGGPCAA